MAIPRQGKQPSGDPLTVRTDPGHRKKVRVIPKHQWYFPIKRLFDVALASLILVVTLPAMVVAIFLVKLSSPGPAIYRQTRSGLKGVPFTIFKIRTMREDAEATTGPVWSSDVDSRITPIGHFLRKTHIDEFPQLINVIRGDMSLIGPRPERPEFIAKLDWQVDHYCERLRVRPGITGLAQLIRPADCDIESVRQKVIVDLYYVANVNPWLDVKVSFFTAWRLAREVYLSGRKCFTLPKDSQVEMGYLEAIGLPSTTATSHVTSIDQLLNPHLAPSADDQFKQTVRDLDVQCFDETSTDIKVYDA